MSDVTAENQTQEDVNRYPSPIRAWCVIILLTLAYIMSYVDRQVLGMLIEPIKADFNFTDTQMGLLGGTAFAIFYATMGIPLAWLADRSSRRNLVAAGVAVWSLATAACGLVRSFGGLFVSRMMVGAGEATLSPCAMSMISDMFPEKQRARAIAVYSSALSIGIGLGSLAVAELLSWAKTLDYAALAQWGIDKPWHMVFVMLGIPGIIIALLFLLIKEPARTGSLEGKVENPASFPETLRFVFSNKMAIIGIFSMGGIMTIGAYYTGYWNVPFFMRTFGWSAETYMTANGWGILALGPVSIITAGFIIDRLSSKGVADAALTVQRVGVILLLPACLAYPLMTDGWTAFYVYLATTFGFTAITAAGPAALLKVAPANMRAQVMALYYMYISMLGLFIGPSIVPFFTDNVFQDPARVGDSLFVVAAIVTVPALLLVWKVPGAYRKMLGAQAEASA